MSEINVRPRAEDSNAGLLIVFVLIVTLVVLAAFSYTNGWFMRNPGTTTPSSNINITSPPVISNPSPSFVPVILDPTPSPTPTLDPTASGSFQGSGGTTPGD